MPRFLPALTFLVCCLLTACHQPTTSPTNPTTEASSPGDKAQGSRSEAGGRGNRPQTVTTVLSKIEDVPLLLEAQGSIQALDEVDIRPQKNGMITAIHFREGEELRKGQLLFTLDARDDVANVGKAVAGVESAEASVAIAQRDLKRAQELSDKQFIAPSALDNTRSKADTATANLAQARAALEQAKVSQSYTRILAPFDGRAGVINVRPGSLVTSNSTATALVHLTRMQPIGVIFTISERDMPPLLATLRERSVKLTTQTNTKATLSGEVSFVDSGVDRASGTLLVKGRLDNKDRLVWPGQFVTVQVAAGLIHNAVVLPAQALVNGPNGRFVYVVQEDQTVQPQPVELIRITDQRAVVTGIGGQVKVVQEGTQNLRPGARIQESQGERGEGRRGKGKRADKTEGTSAGSTATAKLEIPSGFTPRDPERWAQASDEMKREIITRWRERQTAQAQEPK